jgi:hypothetical protein
MQVAINQGSTPEDEFWLDVLFDNITVGTQPFIWVRQNPELNGLPDDGWTDPWRDFIQGVVRDSDVNRITIGGDTSSWVVYVSVVFNRGYSPAQAHALIRQLAEVFHEPATEVPELPSVSYGSGQGPTRSHKWRSR